MMYRPSFLRVGHVELFGRRARDGRAASRDELRLIVEHAIFREYAATDDPAAPLSHRVVTFLTQARTRLATMTAEW